MPSHCEGACGPLVFGLELSLVIVLETEYGDTEHTSILVSENSPLGHFGRHALDEAEPASAHAVERGSYRAPIVAVHLLLGDLVIQIHVWPVNG
jgi:hypothetical protein